MNDCTLVCIDSFEVRNVNRHRQLTCILSALGLLILILDGKTALSGAADGIDMCVRTVIPALFPFFVLSSTFLSFAASFSWREKGLPSLLGFPRGAGALALPCFLGGYPVGAQSVYQAYADGHLRKDSAQKLLAFCNNAGPAFVFGVVGQMFPKPWMPWALWGIHIAGALVAARCLSDMDDSECVDKQPVSSNGDIMAGAVKTMGVVCGWIVLFRVWIAFLNRWFLWLLPQTVRVAVVGLLELSNGCCELTQISNVSIRFILCSGMLAAGGLCVTAQTVSVTKALSLRYYWLGKMIQLLVSLVLSCCIVYRTIVPFLFVLPLLYRIRKKRSGNQALSGV